MKNVRLHLLSPLFKLLLVTLPLFSVLPDGFSRTGFEDIRASRPESTTVNNDTAGCEVRLNDSLQRFVRYENSDKEHAFYYVRLSMFRSEFERLFFYEAAGAREIFITDKHEFHSDSALFMTTFDRYRSMFEFRELYQESENAELTASDELKKEKIARSPFYSSVSGPPQSINSPLTGPNDCSTAEVACSANIYTFPSGTTGVAPPPVNGYPNYGCLGSEPCPAWYYMQVGVAGNIVINISQVGLPPPIPPPPHDVDFICWGPFTSLTEACATGLTGTCGTGKPGNPSCCNNNSAGCTNFYPRGNITDCSYSGSNQETCNILNAQVGEIYILLLTNFSQQPGTITFSQTGGTGVTNCNIVVHCSIIAITADASTCDEATNKFSISGNIEFTNPSPTGTLSITDNTAVPPVSQNFTPPFTSPVAYNITGIPCDGATHSITVVFSDSLNCNLSQQVVSPAPVCPQATLSGGGEICDNGIDEATIQVAFPVGIPPFNFTYSIDGVNQPTVTNYSGPFPFHVSTKTPSTYSMVDVANASCTTGTVTGIATVSLKPVPEVTGPAAYSICSGGSQTITLSSTPVDPRTTYTWTVTCNNISTGCPVNGTGDRLLLNPTNNGTSTGTIVFSVIPTLVGCSGSAYTITITVNPLPVPVLSGNSTACENSPGNLYTTAAGMTNYYWGISGGTITSGGGALQNSATVTWGAAGTGTIRVNYTDPSTSCIGGSPTSYAVTINPLPHLTSTPTPPVCSGTTLGVALTMDVVNPVTPYFTWTATCTPAGSVTGFSATTMSGTTITDNLVNSITATATVTYLVTPYANGCQGITSAYSVVVNPVPHLSNPFPSPLCSGGTFNVNLAMDVLNPVNPYFEWTASCSPLGSVTGFPVTVITGSTVNDVLTNIINTNAIVTYSITPYANSCPGQAAGFPVTVHPHATVNTINPQIMCSGSQTQAVTLSSNVSSPTVAFSWTVSCDAAIPVCPGGGSGNIIPPTPISNTDLVPRYAIYTVTPQVLTCPGSPASFQVQVNPSPTLTTTPLSQAICSGYSSTAVLLTANVNPVSFDWTATPSSPLITGYQSTPGTGNIPIQTISNSSGLQGYVNYHIIPSSQSGMACPGAPADYRIYVNPLPTPAISGPQQACFGAGSVTYSTPAVTGHVCNWTVSGATSFTGNPGNSIQVTWGPGPAGTIQLTETDQNQSTNCFTTTPMFNVAINPAPSPVIAAIPLTASPCGNTQVNYTIGSAQANHSYQWTISGGSPVSGTGPGINVTWGNTNPVSVDVVESVTYAPGVVCSTPASKAVTLSLIPGTAGTITGPSEACQSVIKTFTVNTIPNADSYTWSFVPSTGVTLVNNGNSVDLTFGSTASSGNLFVQGNKTNCASGPVSPAHAVTLHQPPYVSITACNDIKVTTTSRPFTLKGGVPPGGQYYIDGVPAVGGLFNPSILSATVHQVTYGVTDFNTCVNTSPPVSITVMPGSGSGTCPTSFTDPRDNTVYRAFNLGGHCWMLSNLSYGTVAVSTPQSQSDNCVPEKYCLASDPVCADYGGFYQWDELVQYQSLTPGQAVQGLCPPEWHIPSQSEWQLLIDAVSGMSPGDGLAGSYLRDPNSPFGFHALLSGIFYLNDTWAFTSGNLTATMFWTSTGSGSTRAVARGMNVFDYSISLYESSRANALPVRCVKD